MFVRTQLSVGRLFILVLLLGLFSLHASDKKKTRFGDVYISGPKNDKQVFLANNLNHVRVTNYNKWELIETLFISPDDSKLLVYHRPDQSQTFLISLYDLKSAQLIAEVAPGWACRGIHWLSDSIIFVWGTTGGGTRFRYYDYKLSYQTEIQSYNFYIDSKSDRVIGLPMNAAENGIISIFEFSTGKKLSEINFSPELGELYTCSNIERVKAMKYKLTLETMTSDKQVVRILSIN